MPMVKFAVGQRLDYFGAGSTHYLQTQGWRLLLILCFIILHERTIFHWFSSKRGDTIVVIKK